jgi:hypothetical protein
MKLQIRFTVSSGVTYVWSPHRGELSKVTGSDSLEGDVILSDAVCEWPIRHGERPRFANEERALIPWFVTEMSSEFDYVYNERISHFEMSQ